MRRKIWVGGVLTLLIGFVLAFDAPIAYADNCSGLSDCFYTLAAALAVIAALALLIAGMIALPALLAALAEGGLLMAGVGTLGGAIAIPAAAATATNIAAAAAAAAAATAALGAASDLIMQMSSEGTPGNNQAQNKQFRDAIRRAEEQLGKKLTKDQIRQVHDAISHEGMGFHEIVELVLQMFGG